MSEADPELIPDVVSEQAGQIDLYTGLPKQDSALEPICESSEAPEVLQLTMTPKPMSGLSDKPSDESEADSTPAPLPFSFLPELPTVSPVVLDDSGQCPAGQCAAGQSPANQSAAPIIGFTPAVSEAVPELIPDAAPEQAGQIDLYTGGPKQNSAPEPICESSEAPEVLQLTMTPQPMSRLSDKPSDESEADSTPAPLPFSFLPELPTVPPVVVDDFGQCPAGQCAANQSPTNQNAAPIIGFTPAVSEAVPEAAPEQAGQIDLYNGGPKQDSAPEPICESSDAPEVLQLTMTPQPMSRLSDKPSDQSDESEADSTPAPLPFSFLPELPTASPVVMDDSGQCPAGQCSVDQNAAPIIGFTPAVSKAVPEAAPEQAGQIDLYTGGPKQNSAPEPICESSEAPEVLQLTMTPQPMSGLSDKPSDKSSDEPSDQSKERTQTSNVFLPESVNNEEFATFTGDEDALDGKERYEDDLELSYLPDTSEPLSSGPVCLPSEKPESPFGGVVPQKTNEEFATFNDDNDAVYSHSLPSDTVTETRPRPRSASVNNFLTVIGANEICTESDMPIEEPKNQDTAESESEAEEDELAFWSEQNTRRNRGSEQAEPHEMQSDTVVIQPEYDSAMVAALPSIASEAIANHTAQLFSSHHRLISDARREHNSDRAMIQKLNGVEDEAMSGLDTDGLYSYLRLSAGRQRTSTTQDLPGYRMSSYGFEAGVFKVLDNEWLVGVLMSGWKGKASIKSMGASDEITGLRLGPFFSWQRGNLHIDGALTVGYHTVNGKGRDSVTGTHYHGDFTMKDWSGWLGVGYDIHLSPTLILTPMAEVLYINNQQSGFALKGNNGERIKVQGGSRQDRIDRLGVVVNYQLPAQTYSTVVRAGLGVQHNHFAPYKVAMQNGNDSSSVVERKKARNGRVNWYSLGLKTQVDDMRSFAFDLDGTRGGKSNSLQATATFEYKFY